MSSEHNGIFIALEGTDGSGKATQFELLKKRLELQGYDVEAFDFPQYDKESSYFAREYLNGAYGEINEVGPYTASLFFSLDRYAAASKIRSALKKGKVVLANRFTGSNMAHQGTSFSNPEQLRGYFLWLDQIEFDLLKIPRPDLSIVLRVPAGVAQRLVDKKGPRSYTDKKRDLHEADIIHLEKSVEVYDSLCKLFPKDFKQIDCTRGGRLLDIQQVESLVWQTLTPYLPALGSLKKKTKDQIKKDNPYLSIHDDRLKITEEGHKYLGNVVTNTNDNVYAFTDELPQKTIAAAMARLSRRGDDLRITILDEFVGNSAHDEKLLKRVITSYGDDSVQQLAGQHLVVENVSNLLTKTLEKGRLGAYLEQSTRYIYFDETDKNGDFRYYKIHYLNKKIRAEYESTMDEVFHNYSKIVKSLTSYLERSPNYNQGQHDRAWQNAIKAEACDAARHVLPVATTSTVGIFVSAQSLEGLIMRLLSDQMAEANEIGRKILIETRKVIPAFLERIDINERGILSMAYKAFTRETTKSSIDKYLKNNYGVSTTPVQLTDFWPKNELDVVSDIVYEHSSMSLKEIKSDLDSWTINQKKEVLKNYIGDRSNRRHKPGRAFEKAHYSWDILCDYGIFRDLQRHRMVDDLSWQKLSPRFGYDIPKLIEEAGLTDHFVRCFDLSLNLYSKLQANGYIDEAQYATLMGHKMRWKVTFNARQAYHFMELRSNKQGHPTYRKIIKQMYEKLNEVHPLIAGGMKFVNLNDSAGLTRLEAEKYAQTKVKNL